MNYLTRTNGNPDVLKCKQLETQIVDYIKVNVDVAVIGLSGGADSTLVAICSMLALGSNNVHGISLPYGKADIDTFNSRSSNLASTLNIWHGIVNIKEAVDSFISAMGSVSILNAGNARSRMRMMCLYAKANQIATTINNPKMRVRVMGTGNLSEDFIGYDTKGGDALADLFPIGELYKQEVYDMLDYFRQINVIGEEHIDRTPSAGLWEGQTDEQELGYTYNEMAPAIEFIRNRKLEDTRLPYDLVDLMLPVYAFVLNRHLANRHKHMAPPVLSLRPPTANPLYIPGVTTLDYAKLCVRA